FDGPPAVQAQGVVDWHFVGVRFIRFTWPPHCPLGTWWTFGISPVIPFGVGTVVLVFLRIKARKLGAFCCKSCGYNLTANISGICPECGAASKAATPTVQVRPREIDDLPA